MIFVRAASFAEHLLSAMWLVIVLTPSTPRARHHRAKVTPPSTASWNFGARAQVVASPAGDSSFTIRFAGNQIRAHYYPFRCHNHLYSCLVIGISRWQKKKKHHSAKSLSRHNVGGASYTGFKKNLVTYRESARQYL
jgi:hypothetical protein